MGLFCELIAPGDEVVEVGAHIGYIAVLYSELVGPRGRVIVFEPGPNNLPYLRQNIATCRNVTLLEYAVSDFSGEASFFIENYTGQNNSLLSGYGRFDENLKNAGLSKDVAKSVINVRCVTLDEMSAKGVLGSPSLVKVDVEGAEFAVVKGMVELLGRCNVCLMVEVTENCEEVFAFLRAQGYRGFSADRTPITGGVAATLNTFWLKPADPRLARFLGGADQAAVVA